MRVLILTVTSRVKTWSKSITRRPHGAVASLLVNPDTHGLSQKWNFPQLPKHREEALSVLNVTHKSTRWLLKQVHPDKHPDYRAEAEAATARVNQARDVRCRHVTEV